MPKLKTHRGARKRFKITSKGKIKRSKAFASHLKLKKTAKRKRKLRKPGILNKSDTKRIKKLLSNV
ncbi:50S ribosomal protein L35 [Candidatus Aerophobetes bacterium]|uniref:Large ribosomal subunit protein bL35 n=1 Tax=Aerophobetes bacterium TaxID=2030807 RepID=A0A7V0QPW9_UNCAE|nr:50S ribosomal protein L35 [Candidatus Aerophobetes bacterium]HDN84181.1 50S ribosomal protein L35 [Candidatus Aerophobetes bacterium]